MWTVTRRRALEPTQGCRGRARACRIYIWWHFPTTTTSLVIFPEVLDVKTTAQAKNYFANLRFSVSVCEDDVIVANHYAR